MKGEILREIFSESTRLEHEDRWREWNAPCFIRIATLGKIAVYAILYDNGCYGIEPLVLAIGSKCCAACDSHKYDEFLYDVKGMLRDVASTEHFDTTDLDVLLMHCAMSLTRLNYIHNFNALYDDHRVGYSCNMLYDVSNEYVTAVLDSLSVYAIIMGFSTEIWNHPWESLLEGQGVWEKWGSLAEMYSEYSGYKRPCLPSQKEILADYRRATNTARKPRIKTIRGLFWNSYPHKCAICGREIKSIHDMHVDHIIPLARGGEDVISNLQCVHSWCNLAKGASCPEGKR